MSIKDYLNTTVSLFGAAFGLGCLMLPATMSAMGGPALWFIVYTFCIILNMITFENIVYIGETTGITDYMFVYTFFGKTKAKFIFTILFFVTNIGILLYAIFIYNEICTKMVKTITGTMSYLFDNEFSLLYLIIITVIFFPILIKRQLKDLAILTYITMMAGVTLVAFLIFAYIKRSEINSLYEAQNTEGFQLKNLPSPFFTVFFSFVCQPNVLEIYDNLAVKSKNNMRKAFCLFFIMFSVLYIPIALCGYGVFKNHELIQDQNILKLMPENINHMMNLKIFFIIAQSLMLIAALNSFIYLFKAVKDSILSFIETEKEGGQVKKDLEIKNILVTIFTMSGMNFFVGYCLVSDINSLTVLDVVTSQLTPILFVFPPVIIAWWKCKNIPSLLTGIIIGVLFVWNLILLILK